MKPIIIVNCKTYPQATGKKAVALAKLCEEMGKEYGADMRIAVQATDIAAVAAAVKIPVYAQHIDIAAPGKSTGWVTAHAVKEAGAEGVLINHAERPLDHTTIKTTAEHAHRAGLTTVIIAKDVATLRAFNDIHADLLSVEPPELIGGDVSVSVARPDVVASAVHATTKPLLIGAGVKDHNDLSIALSLGARGVLLASGIVLARDQKKALRGLLRA